MAGGMEMLIGALLLSADLVSGCQPHAGPTPCPVENISIPEHSSEMIMSNISSYPNALLLCKKNHSSSYCQPIASIRNGTLRSYLSEYKPHFSVLEHDLVAMNTSRFLIGEYQLCNQLGEDCLQRFFLDVLASDSKPTHYGAIAAAVLVGLVLVGLVLFVLWRKL